MADDQPAGGRTGQIAYSPSVIPIGDAAAIRRFLRMTEPPTLLHLTVILFHEAGHAEHFAHIPARLPAEDREIVAGDASSGVSAT